MLPSTDLALPPFIRLLVTTLSDSAQNTENAKNWRNGVVVANLSDVGMRRANNQDSMAVIVAESHAGWEKLGHCFLVADGMGAHAAGEKASKMAIDLIPHHYRKLVDQSPAESLHRAIAEANAEIYRQGQANIEFRSMGTTCSVLTLLPEGAVAAHVGDSRVYQLRGDKLYQLTFDHSLVWEMQAAGEVTDETARSGVIPKNVITRSLGPNASVQIDLEGPFPIKKGDRFLLCSDGLSGQINDEEIGCLMRFLPPAQAARMFVDLSNLRGGPDNITAIVVEVTDDVIATANQGAISVRRSEKARSFSTALGVVTAVCFSAAFILYLISSWPLALVASVLGLIALLTGLAQAFWATGESTDFSSRYGNGPYRQYAAVPSQALFEHLAGMLKSLKEAADERGWEVNWADLDSRFALACGKADEDNFAEALTIQSGVIIDLMAQIRRQRGGRNASDSAVDL